MGVARMADDLDAVAAHQLVDALRADGYSVGLAGEDAPLVDDFDSHVADGQAVLDADDLSAYFVAAQVGAETNYAAACVVDDPVVWGVSQIQLLGAHFRAVHDALGVDVDTLLDAMVDEALAIDDVEDPRGGDGDG